MSSSRQASAPFKFFWATPDTRKLYTPKQQQLFMVQIGTPSGYNTEHPHMTDPTSPLPTGFAGKDNDNFSVGLFDTFPEAIDASAPMANFEALNGFIWFAKSVSKPSIRFADTPFSGKRRFGDFSGQRQVFLESTPTYEDMTLKMIDPTSPNATRHILRILQYAGFGSQIQENMPSLESYGTGYNGRLASTMLNPVRIYQYGHIPEIGASLPFGGRTFNPNGLLYLLETWELVEPKIRAVNFGSLDYSSEQFVEIDLTLSMNGFNCTTHTVPGPGPDTAEDERIYTSVGYNGTPSR